MNRREFLKSTLTFALLAPAARLAAKAGDGLNKSSGSVSGPQVVRRNYKNTGLSVPLLGYGMMRLPVKDGKRERAREINYAEGERLVARAMQAGINYFDTARFYHGGESENFVGKVLSKYPRDSYYLADKMPIGRCRSASEVEPLFYDQLKKTRAGYFDFYLLHALNRKSWQKTLDFKALDFLLRMQKEGKIRKLGFSFHDSPDVLREIARYRAWDFAQIQLNYLDWEGCRSREQYEILTERGIPVIVMEPLKGGTLAGGIPPATLKVLKNAVPSATPASWAFRFCGSLPNVLCILSGMTKMEHLQENIETFSRFQPLTEFEQKTLRTAIAAGKNQELIPCTGCRYCMPCPAGVEIPAIFTLWNKMKNSRNEEEFRKEYKKLPADGRASACVQCGRCAKRCPQKIDIPGLMKMIGTKYPG